MPAKKKGEEEEETIERLLKIEDKERHANTEAEEVVRRTKEALDASKKAENAQEVADEAQKAAEEAKTDVYNKQEEAVAAEIELDEAEEEEVEAKKVAEEAQKAAEEAQKAAEEAQKAAEEAQKAEYETAQAAAEAKQAASEAQKNLDKTRRSKNSADIQLLKDRKTTLKKAAAEAKQAASEAQKNLDAAQEKSEKASKTVAAKQLALDNIQQTAGEAEETAETLEDVAEDLAETADNLQKIAEEAQKAAAEAQKRWDAAKNKAHKAKNIAKELEKYKGETIEFKAETSLENRRLDGLALLLEGSTMCSAACIVNNKLCIASNFLYDGTRGNNFYRFATNTMNYFSKLRKSQNTSQDNKKCLTEVLINGIPTLACDKSIATVIVSKLLNTNDEWYKKIFNAQYQLKSVKELMDLTLNDMKMVHFEVHKVAYAISKISRLIRHFKKTALEVRKENSKLGIALNNGFEILLTGAQAMHAEMRILEHIHQLHVNPPLYIGISKLCCLDCYIALNLWNLDKFDDINFRGVHGLHFSGGIIKINEIKEKEKKKKNEDEKKDKSWYAPSSYNSESLAIHASIVKVIVQKQKGLNNKATMYPDSTPSSPGSTDIRVFYFSIHLHSNHFLNLPGGHYLDYKALQIGGHELRQTLYEIGLGDKQVVTHIMNIANIQSQEVVLYRLLGHEVTKHSFFKIIPGTVTQYSTYQDQNTKEILRVEVEKQYNSKILHHPKAEEMMYRALKIGGQELVSTILDVGNSHYDQIAGAIDKQGVDYILYTLNGDNVERKDMLIRTIDGQCKPLVVYQDIDTHTIVHSKIVEPEKGPVLQLYSPIRIVPDFLSGGYPGGGGNGPDEDPSYGGGGGGDNPAKGEGLFGFFGGNSDIAGKLKNGTFHDAEYTV